MVVEEQLDDSVASMCASTAGSPGSGSRHKTRTRSPAFCDSWPASSRREVTRDEDSAHAAAWVRRRARGSSREILRRVPFDVEDPSSHKNATQDGSADFQRSGRESPCGTRALRPSPRRQQGRHGASTEHRHIPAKVTPLDRDEKQLCEHALHLGEVVIRERDLRRRHAKALHSYGTHLFGDHPSTAFADWDPMQPATPLDRRKRQHRHQGAAVRCKWNAEETTRAGRSLPCSRPRTGSMWQNHTEPG